MRALLAGFLIVAGALAVWLWSARPAWAVGATQNDKVVICTGQLDDSGEVVYVLDSLTGDLKAFTMHQTGRYSASYYRNIMGDFGLDKSKDSPKFTMVTGQERFARRGPATPIGSVLHVAEGVSGRMVAYTLLWNSALRQKVLDPAKPGSITPLDGVKFRGDIVRNPVSD
jgi:hypothetical protein